MKSLRSLKSQDPQGNLKLYSKNALKAQHIRVKRTWMKFLRKQKGLNVRKLQIISNKICDYMI